MPGTVVGLKDLHYALLLTDTTGGVTYDTPVAVVGAIQANINPNPKLETLFADDGPMEIASILGEIELELIASDFDTDTQAVLLGHTVVGGVMTRGASDIAPWVAIGFRSLKSNGAYRYVWLHKGKFSVPEMKHETKGDEVNFQTPTLAARFVKRDHDEAWIKQADTDHPDYVAETGTNWFLAVEGAPDITAPTATILPLDGAIDVAITANVVWTFSEAIYASDVGSSNFFLIKASDGTLVAADLSINGLHTIVTLNPTGSLGNSTAYIAVATSNVKDLAGNHLAQNKVTDFTTIA